MGIRALYDTTQHLQKMTLVGMGIFFWHLISFLFRAFKSSPFLQNNTGRGEVHERRKGNSQTALLWRLKVFR